MSVDTKVRHVTKAGGNIFLDLGFAPKEARRLHDESQRSIKASIAIKQQLMGELAKWIKTNNLKQMEAAQVLHVTRPRVSDVVNRKADKFTIDALVEMLSRVGKSVTLVTR